MQEHLIGSKFSFVSFVNVSFDLDNWLIQQLLDSVLTSLYISNGVVDAKSEAIPSTIMFQKRFWIIDKNFLIRILHIADSTEYTK